MSELINIKKGLDIPLKGAASANVSTDILVNQFAVCPSDFPGYTWKCIVKTGDEVAIGSRILIAKECPEICLVSPVAGKIADVCRGERRKIEYISINAVENQLQEEFDSSLSILSNLYRWGLFSMIRQRPFDIVPDYTAKPRDIFVTAFDSAPLAGELLANPLSVYLEEGLKALATLTAGKVYLGVKADTAIDSRYAEIVEFKGPHPAGNTGTQIAVIKPVNKGECVWALDALTACRIGKLISTGELDMSALVAVTGPEVKNPHYIQTEIGAKIKPLINGNLVNSDKNIRIISGNVLTGIKVSKESGFLRYPYRQITIIPEGDNADEFMGWASMNPNRFSVSRSFPAFLRGLKKPFNFDARIKGGHRAMIMSGEYDKVFPFDIYPEYLIKAILARNIEKMEQLGIYEVAPEDFALPEFVDSSKMELQKIVRDGLDYLRKELM